MDIKYGEGGDDSRLFVHDLAAAYVKYGKLNNLKSEILYSERGHCTLKFIGQNVWELFKNEPGKHVVQRKPPTESNGRHHTSVVAVAVLPIPTYSSLKTIPENELVITTMVGTGPGGQHRNRTESAVRIVHKPTNVSVVIDSRDQHANKREALHILTARVNELYAEKYHNEYNQNKKKQLGGGTRSGKVRTYNFIDSRCVDHNLNKRTKQLKEIMKGRFDVLFNA